MHDNLRQSMAWLHTWAGVVLGSLLFAIFWMGSLSVFDREIDRWTMPATRLAPSTAQLSLDRDLAPLGDRLAGAAPQWFVNLPNERVPAYRLAWVDPHGELRSRHVDPAGARLLPDPGTHGGTGFIFPFHYKLHLKWKDLGYWLVGVAGMGMLVLLTSGVIIHRKLFAEFFTFRPAKRIGRASLDLHNLTGVLALPFHAAITLSGLIIFWSIYFPWTASLPYGGDRAAMGAEVYGTVSRARTGTPATRASLDAMVRDAERRWAARHGVAVRADLVRVTHPGDAASVVIVRSTFPPDAVGLDRGMSVYDAASGQLLRDHQPGAVRGAHAFISGMHFIQFRHWTLRWLYFAGGLGGCAMIATGFLFWLEARRTRHARQGRLGVLLVEGLAVASVTGIVLATFAWLAANRLLPQEAHGGAAGRALLEMQVFYLVWLASLAHGGWRRSGAWCEQAWAICALALLAAAANWAGTGGGLAAALTPGNGAVAVMDGLLLIAALLAAVAARRLGRRALNVRPANVVAAALEKAS